MKKHPTSNIQRPTFNARTTLTLGVEGWALKVEGFVLLHATWI